MPFIILKLGLGCFLAAVIALAAWRFRSLSRSGAWGAWLEGTIIFGLGGWQWAVVLLGFFLSSSLLTRLFKNKKSAMDEKFEKGGERDIGQVLANGAVASLFAGLGFFFPHPWTWITFAASLAAVNADTWATELGILNPSQPRLITSGRRVERGTSGGISLYGTLAAAAGAAWIALLAVLTTPSRFQGLGGLPAGWFFLFLVMSGLAGALMDSLLGATIQGIYHCPQCDKETEKHPTHSCGTPTVPLRGWKWVNNDLVNLACAGMGSLFMLLLHWILQVG